MPTLDLSHGGRLYYEIRGAPPPPAPPVIFLNGTAQTTVAWTYQVRALSGEYRTICYDARTQGRKSILGTMVPNLDLHLKDLKKLFSHLNLDQAHLIGISHGALLALAFGSRFKSKVTSLVLINPADPASGRSRVAIEAWRKILATGDMHAVAWSMLPLVLGKNYLQTQQPVLDGMAKAIAARNRPSALAAHLAAMTTNPPLTTFVQKEIPPALFITGGDDPLTDAAAIGYLADQCGGQHQILSAAGHSLPVEAPKRCNKIIRAWLAGTNS